VQLYGFIAKIQNGDFDGPSITGNCWFIAAAATLAVKPQLIQNVVPTDQSFTDNYAGKQCLYLCRPTHYMPIIIY